MKKQFLKGFNYFCGRGKKPASTTLKEQVKVIRDRAPGQLHFLFNEVLEPEKIQGALNARTRFYSADVTVWAMLGQVFRGGSLRDAVREVQASVFARNRSDEMSSSTSSYAQARQRLPQSSLDQLHRRVVSKLASSEQWLPGRRILTVDSTGVQLEDTVKNQDAFPQVSNQKSGCGFPTMQITGLFNLDTLAMEHWTYSPINANESAMFSVDLMGLLRPCDVLIADRAFCSYYNMASMQSRGIDSIMRLNGSRKELPKEAGDDVLVTWKRPAFHQQPLHITQQEWDPLSEEMTVRYVRYHLQRKGFRTQTITLATTLLEMPVEELARLYWRRWNVELCFDDEKTTLGMDFIRAKSPEMAIKMITVYMIAYNLIRWLIQQAASQEGTQDWSRLSFKGTLDGLHRFASVMQGRCRKMFNHLRYKLLESIAQDVIPYRPERFEPRLRKRRPKPFELMPKPRNVLKAEILKNIKANFVPKTSLS